MQHDQGLVVLSPELTVHRIVSRADDRTDNKELMMEGGKENKGATLDICSID